MYKKYTFIALILILSCQKKTKTIHATRQTITESVYASGIVISENQYKVFSKVNGIVDEIFIEENDLIEEGSLILNITNDAQSIMKDNAKLNYDFNAISTNKGKLLDAKTILNLAKTKMDNDALQLNRQQKLWAQNIGTKIALEQKELSYLNAKANYVTAKEKFNEINKLIVFSAKQAQNNLSISNKNNNDFMILSRFKGKVYQLNVKKGEMVNPQIPIAIIGDEKNYLLEMQVDEYDIMNIKLGMKVIVVFNSYKNEAFEASVSKIIPIMNVQTKTFTIEAKFVKQPTILYPNVSFEANIILKEKKNALLIPRNYLLNDSTVIDKSGNQKTVIIGLKDYQMVEILKGLNINEELILP